MILIELRPTRRHEKLHGVQYRIFEGRTNTGITLEMLGLFRITDVNEREQFERAVCAVGIDDVPPVTLLTAHGLIKP